MELVHQACVLFKRGNMFYSEDFTRNNMEIVVPTVELLSPLTREEGIQLLRRIESFGRISHESEGLQTETSWEPFINKVVMGHGVRMV